MPLAILTYSDSSGPHSVILDKLSTSLGRSPGQTIMLRDAQVSRCHALIVRKGDRYEVVDQKSTCGTFLNAARIDQAMLKPGDVLHLGSLSGPELRFEVREDEEDTTVTGHSEGSLGNLLSSLHQLRVPGPGLEATGREMEHLNWLLRAARQLNEGGATEEILSALLELTLQLTGVERGFAFLCEHGEMRFAQGLSADGKIVEEDFSISRRAMQQAIESESKFSISDTLKDDRAAEWSSVIVNRIRSIYCIPLRTRGSAKEPSRLLGLLYLDSQIRPGVLSKVDHQLLDTIAREATSLLHNAMLAEAEHKARLAQEELAVAAKIHSGLMSISLPTLPYAAIEARSVPCSAIGGDFYDVVELDDCVCMTIVDVSGKGVSAAIVAATLQGIIHAQLTARQGLAEVALMVNRFLCARRVGKYATMVILRLFPDGRLEYVNCGHIPPLILHGSRTRELAETNLIVGLIPAATYTCANDRLEPGERLLLVTDGITEAENSLGEAFGDLGWAETARESDLATILDRVARFHAPHPAQDDCTLLEVRYTG